MEPQTPFVGPEVKTMPTHRWRRDWFGVGSARQPSVVLNTTEGSFHSRRHTSQKTQIQCLLFFEKDPHQLAGRKVDRVPVRYSPWCLSFRAR